MVFAKPCLNLLCDKFGSIIPSGDYETIAGFIINQIGRIPNQGEHIFSDIGPPYAIFLRYFWRFGSILKLEAIARDPTDAARKASREEGVPETRRLKIVKIAQKSFKENQIHEKYCDKINGKIQ